MAVTEGQLISDGTAVWKVKKIGNGELPVGTMQMFAGNTIPAGWLLCDGSAVSRTDYAKLFSAIGTIYGAGDGSTTFALPNLIDRFLQGSATAGVHKAAGLPNITGKWESSNSLNNYASQSGFGDLKAKDVADTDNNLVEEGALYTTKYRYQYGYSDAGAVHQYPDGIGFDASRSNSIYGNSTTVQPPALTMLPIIKY